MKIRSIAPERWNDKFGSVQTLLAVCFLLTFAGRLAARVRDSPGSVPRRVGGLYPARFPDARNLTTRSLLCASLPGRDLASWKGS